MRLTELWAYVERVERDLQVDGGMVDSMEVVEPHQHYCTGCRKTWSHADETAEECRWAVGTAPGNGIMELTCPQCQDLYLLDLYAGDPPDTPDILDENLQRDAEDADWDDDSLRMRNH